jgi:single-strand DNA-binding protein
MSRSLNKVMLIGNLGSDPEVRTTPSGTKVAKVSLATNRTFQDRTGQQQEKTEWHRLTFFGRMAEIVEQYVSKGDRLYVEGRLEYSQSEDPQGNVRYWTDIVATEMVLLGSGGGPAEGGGGGGFGGGGGNRGGFGGGGGGRGRGPQGGDAGPDLSEPDDDLPF